MNYYNTYYIEPVLAINVHLSSTLLNFERFCFQNIPDVLRAIWWIRPLRSPSPLPKGYRDLIISHHNSTRSSGSVAVLKTRLGTVSPISLINTCRVRVYKMVSTKPHEVISLAPLQLMCAHLRQAPSQQSGGHPNLSSVARPSILVLLVLWRPRPSFFDIHPLPSSSISESMHDAFACTCQYVPSILELCMPWPAMTPVLQNSQKRSPNSPVELELIARPRWAMLFSW